MPRYIIKDTHATNEDEMYFEHTMSIAEKESRTYKDKDGNSCFDVFGELDGRFRFTVQPFTLIGSAPLPLATRKFGDKYTTPNFNKARWV